MAQAFFQLAQLPPIEPLDAQVVTITRQEFNLFHNIDRRLYTLLAMELFRDPVEALKIVAFWICMERFGFRNAVNIVLNMPVVLINELAEEAVTCLNYLHLGATPFLTAYHIGEVVLTPDFLGRGFGLEFLDRNRAEFLRRLAQVTEQVCNRALLDIMKEAQERNALRFRASGGSTSMVSSLLDPICPELGKMEISPRRPHPDERTLFVTFSRGYPVAETEIREYFTMVYGELIESLHMQEVKSPTEQPLYARIVFYSVSAIQNVLKGTERLKLTINGKHAWMRKFVPKHKRAVPEAAGLLLRRPRLSGFPALAP